MAARGRARPHLVGRQTWDCSSAPGSSSLATGLLIVVGDHDDMHRRMPFQVLPRRLAAVPLGVGATLLALAAMVALLP